MLLVKIISVSCLQYLLVRSHPFAIFSDAENICPQCGLQDIRFAPLSIEVCLSYLYVTLLTASPQMEPPMSRWFESAPSALDTFGYALRVCVRQSRICIRILSSEVLQLQFDAMSKLIRFYKKKYVQYRPAYDRLKQEHAENKQLRRYAPFHHLHSSF